jgi:hypothetical protein
MATVVIRTNLLCGNCLYLPAIDLDDSAERRCAVESNDLCADCWKKQTSSHSAYYDMSDEMAQKIRLISPWWKALLAVDTSAYV